MYINLDYTQHLLDDSRGAHPYVQSDLKKRFVLKVVVIESN